MKRPRIVFVAVSSGGHRKRCYHVRSDCVAVLEPIATFETGPHSAKAAGFRLCTKCAWRDLGRTRPTCRKKHPEERYRCQLLTPHRSAHYAARGSAGPLRWPLEAAVA